MTEKTILAVDVGGTKILIGEVSMSGKVLNQVKRPSDISSQNKAVEQIISVISEYLEHRVIGDIHAISIDTVGRVNSDQGIWYEIDPKMVNKMNVSEIIRQKFDLPCYLINDLAAATVAENSLGIGNDTKNFIYMSIGTGIAGRLVVDGKILLGEDYDAGEIGHMVVDSESKVQCDCGRFGCVEPLASGLGMSNRAHEMQADYETSLKIVPGQRVGAPELFAAYDKGDALAMAVVNQSLSAVSNMIMNLVRAINPKAIRFGGGVTTGDWYLNHLQKYLDPLTMRFVTYGVKNTELDPNLITLQGCALFAIENLK